jgi:hypothetical protein
MLGRDQGIGHVSARGDCSDDKVTWPLRRQIFETMNRNVDDPVVERLLNLFREEPHASDCAQRRIEITIAACLDLDELDSQFRLDCPK